MSKYTFVVEFEDGKEPAVGGATEILGGRLCFVAFEDIRDYQLTSDEAGALTAKLMEEPEHSSEICEEHGVSFDEIINKLQSAI